MKFPRIWTLGNFANFGIEEVLLWALGSFATGKFRESAEIRENFLHANISCYTVRSTFINEIYWSTVIWLGMVKVV